VLQAVASFESRIAAAPMAPPAQSVRPSGIVAQAAAVVEPPPWEVAVSVTDAASEFAIGQAVTLPSDGESHTLQIASQTLPATLKRRTTPRIDRAVYLVAEAVRPAGVWSAGPLQSYRDGTLVGRTPWQPAQGERLEIALGQDDLMHVDVETPGNFTQSKGVFGGSVERTSSAVYAIVNQHPNAVTVEMLDASPVSRTDAIKVAHKYEPLPAVTDWNKLPGVAAWTLTIAAQKTQRVGITHVVTSAKDAQIANLP
jgi:uncharacterized protein (TIGR02231 family)